MVKKVAISLGDPTSISPEILVKGYNYFPPDVAYVVYGSSNVIEKAKSLTSSDFSYQIVHNTYHIKERGFYLIDIDNYDFEFGRPSALSGKASVSYLQRAVEDVLSYKVDALVTLPISKRWIMESGFKYAGHTDYLAEVSKVKEYVMVLMCPDLIVGLITTHIPLREVPTKVDTDRIVSKTVLFNNFLRNYLGKDRPKIAILGLNPHASDNGNIGDEEGKIIVPAVEELWGMGVDATFPLSPDTAFVNYRDYDGYIAMYHDQGLIPLKMLCFRRAVNITLGLRFIRTSPDHGTGYDIAGKNLADPSSLVEAVRLAARLIGIVDLK
ncbi:MAG: 4-hydroxythreonine-4-phosphate dehydrogenase PdxA [Hydrogenothermaceae bacterium]|nr:4-hydroxythreonine-4-phosphate dehydrogenase PdxA [Hydrogenothermaceae bacterium]